MEILRDIPEIGDKVTYLGETSEYLTNGATYTIIAVDVDGDAEFIDDDGDREYINHEKKKNYGIVSTSLEDPGYILIESIQSTSDGDKILTVLVDYEGFKSVEGLAIQHAKATKSAAIERQIEELKNELKNL